MLQRLLDHGWDSPYRLVGSIAGIAVVTMLLGSFGSPTDAMLWYAHGLGLPLDREIESIANWCRDPDRLSWLPAVAVGLVGYAAVAYGWSRFEAVPVGRSRAPITAVVGAAIFLECTGRPSTIEISLMTIALAIVIPLLASRDPRATAGEALAEYLVEAVMVIAFLVIVPIAWALLWDHRKARGEEIQQLAG